MRIVKGGVSLCAFALAVATAVMAQPPSGPGDAPQPTVLRVPADPSKPDDPAARTRLEQLLADWERSWASTRAVEARFVVVKSFPAWGSEDRYEGTVLVAHPDKLKVTLEAVVPDPAGGEPLRRFHHQIVGSGRNMVFLANDTKQVFLHGWGGPGKQTVFQDELLALLFGMKSAEVEERFRVTLVKQTAQFDHLQLVPKQPGNFSRFDLVLDHKTLLPRYLRLLELNGKDTQTYSFTKARRNPPGLTASDFQTAVPKGWTVMDMRLPEPLTPSAFSSRGSLPPPITSEVAPPGSSDAVPPPVPSQGR
jgi:outer membrane lipoprotein-sorting protein